MKGLLWIRASKSVSNEAIKAVIEKISPYFKDHGIELIVLPEAFDVMSLDDAKAFLAELKELIEKDH